MPENRVALMTWAMSVLVGLSLIACLGCVKDPNTPPPLPPEKVEDCSTACGHLRGEDGSGLDCELGKLTKRGKTCEDLCKRLENNGRRFISCTINAPSCEAADNCQ